MILTALTELSPPFFSLSSACTTKVPVIIQRIVSWREGGRGRGGGGEAGGGEVRLSDKKRTEAAGVRVSHISLSSM